ncbi:uncharacterized protein N7469_006726 [Penicillium citrinum]|uniref:R3H domain protein n=1 Tax=Penicillium citrinum TaxID=5077 RepID=A0A9W9NV98_PENCI|nr:uncharacterized protein N7469_006726 [Penicillium citrinum]KAJ5226720.1 hypothetical protein N7469_006726 [Penicillium citrinum]
MAAPNTTSGGDTHFSFAKIAAMPATLESQSSAAHDDSNDSQLAIDPADIENHHAGVPLPHSNHPHSIKQTSSLSDPCVDDLGRAVQDIDITLQNDRLGSGSSLNGQENGLLKREDSFDDDRTHLSNSSTKMTNFDSKSLASVTTFAMDEKDSVRPDDSASVQAIDDEESLSGPASGAPNSVTGSEAGGRGIRDQFRDGSALRPRGVLPVPGPLFNGGSQRGAVAVFPDSVSNNFIAPANPGSIPDGSGVQGLPQEPDEKLLEAMKTPKDRLLILQLEEKITNFIKDSEEQSLELPPSNAFGRLLAHKLGDYYHLTHFVDNNVTSVRLHRTPFCRIPTPLSELHAATNSTPPPALPAMKIMRRTDGERPPGEGSTAASSSVPSKATSEAGDSGVDGDRGDSSGATPAKDRLTLTREEREAKYQEARERIFRDFPDSAKSDTGDSNPNMSRSSSTTGRKKNNKMRNPNDDGFEARSQFNAYYPGTHYSNGSISYNGAINDGYPPNPVPYLVGPGGQPPPGGYVPAGQNSTMHPGQMGMNNMSQYPVAVSPQMGPNSSWQGGNIPQQQAYSGFPSMNPPGMMGQQSSNKPSPTMNNYTMPQSQHYQQSGNWNNAPYSGSYQQSPLQRNQPPVHWPNYPQQQSMTPNMPANPYAQFPGQHLNNAMQNQAGRPVIPGGYERSHFNPQTRAFIPGGAPLSRHASRGAQPMPYSNMQPNLPTQPQWNGYSDPIQTRGQDHSPVNTSRTASVSSRDSIAKWGTPSHLPPKPPPSEVPSEFDLKGRSGSSYQSNGIPSVRNGPLVVSGGTGAPNPN